MLDTYQEIFLSLVQAGLWEKNADLLSVDEAVFNEVYKIADEQSVMGLVAAGIEHAANPEIPKEVVLKFVGQTLQLEQRNMAMNKFIAVLVDRMRKAGIYTLLIKGQGVAQCYERPLWRSCGDVDFYLSESNYDAAKIFLKPMASNVEKENKQWKHLGMSINSWVVELHGTIHSSLSRKINKGLNEIHKSIFYGGEVKSWNNEGVTVFLPSVNNDIIIVFSHFITHFYIGGIGLRQICDWCRLLWTNKENIDTGLLERRITKMGLLSEWQVFGALAVEFLGMPQEAMPFYDSRFTVKGEMVLKRILKCGNFGHNNDLSYRAKYSGMRYKMVAMWRRIWDFASLVPVFPIDAPKFFVNYLFAKVK